MVQLYEGESPEPQSQIMWLGDLSGNNLMSYVEAHRYFYFHSFVEMDTLTIWAGGQDAVSHLGDSIRSLIFEGDTPMFGVNGDHSIVVCGVSTKVSSGSVEAVVVADPATPDTAREKFTRIPTDKFYQRANVSWHPAKGLCWHILSQSPRFPQYNTASEPMRRSSGFELEFGLSNIKTLDRRQPYPPVANSNEFPDIIPPGEYDSIFAAADIALSRFLSPNLLVSASNYTIDTTIMQTHYGNVYATSLEYWNPGAAGMTIPSLYMWVVELLSDADNTLLGAVLLKYGNLDSCLSVVWCPPRSLNGGFQKRSKYRSWQDHITLEDIMEAYSHPVAVVHTEDNTLSSFPLLDLPVFVTANESGDEIVFDYFGNELVRNLDGSLIQSGQRLQKAASQDHSLPAHFSLVQNYPNPFNPNTRIEFTARTSGSARLEVLNILGQSVTTLFDQDVVPGEYGVDWNGRDSHGSRVASGVYFYRLTLDGHSQTRKMELLK